MLNYLWGLMIIIGIIVGIFSGRIDEISIATLSSSKEAVTLCISMLGVMAMKELKKLNKDSEVASDDMCTFLIINISSLQLIPVNIIAYRSQYGSVNPTEILGAGIVATMLSTFIGVIFVVVARKLSKRGKYN